MARSAFSCSFFASLRYMNTVRNGACPLVVMSVITWYWIVWTPLVISFLSLVSTISAIFSSDGVQPNSSSSSITSLRIFSRDILTNGARCASDMLCPPYWLDATCAIICVAILHAVEKLCGFSIRVSLITVPFWSISSRLTRSQLCMCCA